MFEVSRECPDCAEKDQRIVELEANAEKMRAAIRNREADNISLAADLDVIIQRAKDAERERDEFKQAWLTVCHEGNVPQYEHAEDAHPEGILHGVRQLACLWSGERSLRERAERERDEARKALVRLADQAELTTDYEESDGGTLHDAIRQAREVLKGGA
jgi:hypothetical protein